MKSKKIAIATILAATLMGSAITVYSQPAPAGDMPEGMQEMGGCQCWRWGWFILCWRR